MKLIDLTSDLTLDVLYSSSVSPTRYVYKIAPPSMHVVSRSYGASSKCIWFSILDRLNVNLEAVEVGELAGAILVIECALENFGVVSSTSESDHGRDVSEDGFTCLVLHLAEVLVSEGEREAKLSGFGKS